MSLSAKIRRAPLRLASGAFILNSGVGKLAAEDETATRLHGMAAGTYPALGKLDPKLFAKALAVGEIAVGGLLLTPLVPAGIAGLALTGFAGGLLGMYAKTPGMRKQGSVFPTQQGVPLAKDGWLAAMGLGLLLDAALTESPVTDDSHAVKHRG